MLTNEVELENLKKKLFKDRDVDFKSVFYKIDYDGDDLINN